MVFSGSPRGISPRLPTRGRGSTPPLLEGSTPRAPGRGTLAHPVVMTPKADNQNKIDQAVHKIQDATAKLKEVQKDLTDGSNARNAANERRGQASPSHPFAHLPTPSRALAASVVRTSSWIPQGPSAPSASFVVPVASTCRPVSPSPATQARSPLPSSQALVQRSPEQSALTPKRCVTALACTGLAAVAAAAVTASEDEAKAGFKKKINAVKAALEEVENIVDNISTTPKPTPRRSSYHAGVALQTTRNGPPRQARMPSGIATAPANGVAMVAPVQKVQTEAMPLVPVAVRGAPTNALGATSSFIPPLAEVAREALATPLRARSPPPTAQVLGRLPTSYQSRSVSPPRRVTNTLVATTPTSWAGGSIGSFNPHPLLGSRGAVPVPNTGGSHLPVAHSFPSAQVSSCAVVVGSGATTGSNRSSSNSPEIGGRAAQLQASQESLAHFGLVAGDSDGQASQKKELHISIPSAEEAEIRDLISPSTSTISPNALQTIARPPAMEKAFPRLFESEPQQSTADAGYGSELVRLPSPHHYENHPMLPFADARYGGPRTPLGNSLRANVPAVHENKPSPSKADERHDAVKCN